MIAVDERRIRHLNTEEVDATGSVVYWMQRDQRVHDNWALLSAFKYSLERKVPLYVVFTLQEISGRTYARHYDFMLRGLHELGVELKKFNIPFCLLRGEPSTVLPDFVTKQNVGQVVTDFSPMRYARKRRDSVAQAINVSLVEVDAHNIVPVWEASNKLEFAAYTLRPKLHRKLSEFLTDFPSLASHPYVERAQHTELFEIDEMLQSLHIDNTVAPTDWLTPGSEAGRSMLELFITERFPDYAENRNDPNKNALSNLSPYLHFGQLSAQRVALSVKQVTGVAGENKDSYLDEVIVRRELSDNYCFYNEHYNQVKGAHAWAQQTIAEHASDVREHVYTQDQLELAQTHDELWNAMQLQMVTEGKMHGWCRMYWAKKILEWTPDTQTAVDIALYLNDKYELDGNDPNGVVGVMWSICGVHDRAWTERPIFGKIRYMNYKGAKRKFDIESYIARYTSSPGLFNE